MGASIKPWTEMTDRERDVVIAERVMGLTVTHNRFVVPGQEPTYVGWDTNSVAGGTTRLSIPHYTTDHAAARLVEDEIGRRKLGTEYARRLLAITSGEECDITLFGEGHLHAFDLYEFAAATPAQRCEAAWRVLGGM